jgi:hypothetical protein
VELGGVGERARPVGRLAVERRALVRVLAVRQVRDLLEHEGEALRVGVVRDLVEVRGDLGEVGGDGAERLGRKPVPGVRGHLAERAHLLEQRRVVAGRRHGDDPGGVPGGGAQERSAGDVDQLDRLVDADVRPADLGRERLHVDDDEVDRADAVLRELEQLLIAVAARQDPRVDRRVERPDLAADERRDLGQVGDRRRLDAIRGKVLAGSVGGDDLDPEGLEVAGERAEALAVGDGEQRSHLRGSSRGGTSGQRPLARPDQRSPRPVQLAGATSPRV